LFRVKRLPIDTQSEHVIFVHEGEVQRGALGFVALDRVRITGCDASGQQREIIGVLNFCSDSIVAPGEIGLSIVAHRDLGLPDGASVRAAVAPAPRSVDRVRERLRGVKLGYPEFREIVADVAAHRYSKVELAMFVLACALRELDLDEIADLTRAMIETGDRLDFGPGPVADKHCVGGIPGNRTTMVAVPILAALGLRVPKTSSRAITSPAGTADTMGVLADVALTPERLYEVVGEAGACIAWGGALRLAPADDVLITVERPMEIDSEAQMIASILAKKKTAGATHALIDVPVGPTAKVRTREQAAAMCDRFRAVAPKIGLTVELVVTETRGPIGTGIGPRLEALDVLAVLSGRPEAPADLREKSLFLASRILEMVGARRPGASRRAVCDALDSGAAARAFERIVRAQGERALPDEARFRDTVAASRDGRVQQIDCWRISRVAKHAGAPVHPAAGIRILKCVGDLVRRGEPIYEIHAQSQPQLEEARGYAGERPEIFGIGS